MSNNSLLNDKFCCIFSMWLQTIFFIFLKKKRKWSCLILHECESIQYMYLWHCSRLFDFQTITIRVQNYISKNILVTVRFHDVLNFEINNKYLISYKGAVTHLRYSLKSQRNSNSKIQNIVKPILLGLLYFLWISLRFHKTNWQVRDLTWKLFMNVIIPIKWNVTTSRSIFLFYFPNKD